MFAFNVMFASRNCGRMGLSIRKLHSSCLSSSSNRSGRKDKNSKNRVLEMLDNASVGRIKGSRDQMWLDSSHKGVKLRDQGQKAFRPQIDPQETSIILFPGQGVQYVGMGQSLLKLPEVKSMFHDANEILKYDLLSLCLKGPQNKLDWTVHCQPAIFVASLAALQLMIEERQLSVESCVATAGFSVGEYAALVLANSLTFETGLKLVKKRAELMQLAAEEVRGRMMTVFLSPAAKIGHIIDGAISWCIKEDIETPVCAVANYLYPNCLVLAGNTEALQFIEENSKDLNIRKCKQIPVSGAFHTKLMRPAAVEFAGILEKADIMDPHISVHSNVDGLPYRDAKDIKKKLVKQIWHPVKWEQTMRVLYDRPKNTAFPQTFELGPGKSLTTLLKYANAPASKDCVNIFA